MSYVDFGNLIDYLKFNGVTLGYCFCLLVVHDAKFSVANNQFIFCFGCFTFKKYLETPYYSSSYSELYDLPSYSPSRSYLLHISMDYWPKLF